MFINSDFVYDKCKLKVRKTFIGKFQIFCSENKNKKRVMRFFKKFHPPLLSVAVGFISVTPTSDKRGEQVVDWLLVDFWLDWFLVGSRAGSQRWVPESTALVVGTWSRRTQPRSLVPPAALGVAWGWVVRSYLICTTH